MKIERGLSEGQVLQRAGVRGGGAKISGSCGEIGVVRATLFVGKKKVKGWSGRPVGKASRGLFSCHLEKLPAGGPYRLELDCQGERGVVREFFVGDVWVLAGQSNMQGYGNLSTAPFCHPMVRCFSMRRVWRLAAEPMCLPSESPDICHNGGSQISVHVGEALRKNSGKGVGPGLFFAEEMWKRSGVPQGLICAAHGGTSMSQWSPERELNGTVGLYGSLLDSVAVTGQGVAGVLWYQGESDANAEASPHYTDRMKKLVACMRKDLRQAGLPWLMVQIGRVFRESSVEENRHWNSVQEQQRQLPGKIRNLSVVSAIDLPLDDNIHLSSSGHGRLGKRLAREAERLVYGNRKERKPPQLRSVASPKILKQKPFDLTLISELVYDGVAGALEASGEPAGFALVNKEGQDLQAIFKTTLHGNKIRLHLRSTFDDAMLHYGFGSSPVCNIRDGQGRALPVFGPCPLGKAEATLPFIKEWKVTAPAISGRSLASLSAPDPGQPGATVRVYGKNDFNLDGFINEHPRWSGHEGLACFFSTLTVPEPMKLEFLMGYDGPFRLWIDQKPFFTDLYGSNPCFPDQSRKAASLKSGKYSIRVAMDINHGQAWGFFLRFVRKGLSSAEIGSGDYVRPEYGV